MPFLSQQKNGFSCESRLKNPQIFFNSKTSWLKSDYKQLVIAQWGGPEFSPIKKYKKIVIPSHTFCETFWGKKDETQRRGTAWAQWGVEGCRNPLVGGGHRGGVAESSVGGTGPASGRRGGGEGVGAPGPCGHDHPVVRLGLQGLDGDATPPGGL